MASPAQEGHLSKKVRIRKCKEDPPPGPKPTYSVAITGASSGDVGPEDSTWLEEDIIKLEEGDITHLTREAGDDIFLSQSFKEKLDKQWEKTVVVKLIGRRIGYQILCSRLKSMWNPRGPMKVVDLDYDYFLVKFIDDGDFMHALTNGPWIIFGHALSVQQWMTDFCSSQGKVTGAVVWIRFPELSMAHYHPMILNALGNLVGQTIKIDEITMQMQRQKFARVAIDIDLSIPLRNTVELDGETIMVTLKEI